MDNLALKAEETRRYMLVYYVALASIVWFDWLVTLHKEYRKIWKSNWNAVKIVYLVLRYSMLALTIFILQGFNMDWSTSRCDKYLLGWQNALPLIIQTCIGFMLMLRCAAMWGQNKLILAFLMVLHAAHMGVSCWLSIADVKTIVFAEGSGPCIPHNTRPNLMLGCILALVYDLAATFLTLYKACQVKAIMGKTMKSTIVLSIIRQGTLYAFGTALVVCANMALIHESRMRGTPFRGYLGGNLCTVFNTILACRLALSLKKDAEARRKPIAESLTGFNSTVLPMGGTDSNGMPMSPLSPNAKLYFGKNISGNVGNGSGYSYNPSTSGGSDSTAWYSGFKSITSARKGDNAHSRQNSDGKKIHLPSFPKRTASQTNKYGNNNGTVKLELPAGEKSEYYNLGNDSKVMRDIELDYIPDADEVDEQDIEKNSDEMRRLSDVISAIEESHSQRVSMREVGGDLEKGGDLNEKRG